MPGTGRVIFGTESPSTYGVSPNYNYPYSTQEFNHNSVYHAVVVNGLTAGTLYHFRPVTKAIGSEIRGPEVLLPPKYPGLNEPQTGCKATVCPACEKAVVKKPTVSSAVPAATTNKALLYRFLKISDVEIQDAAEKGKSIMINGTGAPNSKIKILIN